jgi:3-deoxy-manno-octulosonate cytidylyltransferase (CMP-KDO synthetase)
VAEELFRIVIPARFESTRLPGKVLLDIAGKPMIQHVWERAQESGAIDIVIATDSDQVANVAHSFGADVCMTSESCNSGSDRVAEVCRLYDWQDDMPVVNVQGDAPLIPPASIRRAAGLLIDDLGAGMSTLCVAIGSEEEFLDPNVVKVVFDGQDRAIYFSRAPIPAGGHGSDPAWQHAWRHLGLYAYRPVALQRLSKTDPCQLEQLERLEQLRAIWLGMEIKIAVDTEAHGPDVDTASDLEKVEVLLAARTALQDPSVKKSEVLGPWEPVKAREITDEENSAEDSVTHAAPGEAEELQKTVAGQVPDPVNERTEIEPPLESSEEQTELGTPEEESSEAPSNLVQTDAAGEQQIEPDEDSAGLWQPVSILFVCMGNICRSPTAEGVLRSLVEATEGGDSVTIDSAGTQAYHKGEPPDGRATAIAARRGIDLSMQRARGVELADFTTFDYILAMDEDNLAFLESMRPEDSQAEVELFMNYSRRSQGASVPDPYYGGTLGFERVLEMLEEAGLGLLEELRRRN